MVGGSEMIGPIEPILCKSKTAEMVIVFFFMFVCLVKNVTFFFLEISVRYAPW